jgi:hypothetical protein
MAWEAKAITRGQQSAYNRCAMDESAADKGKALERAVRAIEELILRCRPEFSEQSFRIESNKILTVAGVRHEIDLHVTVLLGAGYDSVFIFECRNRREKVDKNDIIVFAEKISASRAQRGFFVALGYTADAAAQAAQDKRIELISAEQLDPSTIALPCEGVQLGFTKTALHVEWANADLVPKDIKLDSAFLEESGKRTTWSIYQLEWTRALMSPLIGKDVAGVSRNVDLTDRRDFADQGVLLAGYEIRSLTLWLGTNLKRSTGTRVVSAFEVKTRGRVVTVEVEADGFVATVEAVDVPGKQGARGV